ncbi:immunomodulatory protein, partial [Pluteus cervinus]
MKFTSFLASLALVVLPASATSVSVAFDTVYDNASGSLTSVACSDGTNGLITRGYTTFGSLKAFPNIAAAGVVEGWNSQNCGTCWKITYGSKSINVLAVDHAGSGSFNLALAAMNTLTNGQAQQLGRITADATLVAA